jgi:hypothetical protein
MSAKTVEYKKTIHLGKVDFNNRGRCDCAVDVEVEIRVMENKDGQHELSICGNIWNHQHTDTHSGGQNGDTIAKLFPNNPKVQRIVEVWDRWHLNGMCAACEHQRAAGWLEVAARKVTIYNWTLTSTTAALKRDTEKNAIKALVAGETVTLTANQITLLSLSHSLKGRPVTLPGPLSPFYEPEKATTYSRPTEEKMLGWLREDEHPDGILSKACPTCGYKYGSAWLVEPLPAEIEAEVKTW